MILRPYQSQALDACREIIREARRAHEDHDGVSRACIVLCAPTGAGKTVMAAEMIRAAVARSSRVVVVAHRKELIDQTIDKLSRFGVSAGVIMAADKRRDDYLPVQVCSIQTLARRLDRLPPAELVVIDECHHAASQTYKDVLGAYPQATVIGLTATPWRADKTGLADIFDALVLAATPAELMAMGALVPYDPFAYDAPDLHEVRTVAGDYNQGQLGIACNTDVLVGSIVREWLTHASGRRTILFPVNVAHSQHLVGEFRAAGIAAEHLDCHTPKLDRERMIAGLASGAVTVLSSVGVLTEGFDSPAAEVCVLARPTKSLVLHLQMIGRVLRPSPDTGKQRALVHDHAGNLLRLGLPEDPREYKLGRTPDRVRELHTCPLCQAIFGAVKADGTCPKCGGVIAPPRDVSQPGPRDAKTTVQGRRLSRDEIEQLRRQRAFDGVRTDITDTDMRRIVEATPEERAGEYLRLCAIAEQHGYAGGWASKTYRQTFGEWPKFSQLELERSRPAKYPFVPLPRKDRSAA